MKCKYIIIYIIIIITYTSIFTSCSEINASYNNYYKVNNEFNDLENKSLTIKNNINNFLNEWNNKFIDINKYNESIKTIETDFERQKVALAKENPPDNTIYSSNEYNNPFNTISEASNVNNQLNEQMNNNDNDNIAIITTTESTTTESSQTTTTTTTNDVKEQNKQLLAKAIIGYWHSGYTDWAMNYHFNFYENGTVEYFGYRDYYYGIYEVLDENTVKIDFNINYTDYPGSEHTNNNQSISILAQFNMQKLEMYAHADFHETYNIFDIYYYVNDIVKEDILSNQVYEMTKEETNYEVNRIGDIWKAQKAAISNDQYKTVVSISGIIYYDYIVRMIELSKKTKDDYYVVFSFDNHRLIFAYVEGIDSYRFYFKDGILFRVRYCIDAKDLNNFYIYEGRELNKIDDIKNFAMALYDIAIDAYWEAHQYIK